jgi:hypothetical protein
MVMVVLCSPCVPKHVGYVAAPCFMGDLFKIPVPPPYIHLALIACMGVCVGGIHKRHATKPRIGALCSVPKIAGNCWESLGTPSLMPMPVLVIGLGCSSGIEDYDDEPI